MVDEKKSGSRFIVDLGDIKLPSLVERRVEAEIQAVVLRALADGDYGIKHQDRAPFIRSTIWDQFPGRTLGLWIGDQYKPPFISGSGGFRTLTVEDHTLIVKAVMEHPMQVLRYLPNVYKSKNGGRPSGIEVLQATLQVDQIDDYVKERIQAVLDILPKIAEGQATLPEPIRQSLDDLRRQLASKPVDEHRSLLRDVGLRGKYRDSGLAEGMEIAARMLEDGRDSIYSLDHSFYTMLEEGQGSSRAVAKRDAISDVGSADTIGATAGGAVGSLAGGVGAGPGAVAGGVGGSVGAAAAHLIAWIFDW